MCRAALVSATAHALVLLMVALWLEASSSLPQVADQGLKVELVLLETRGAGKPAQRAPPPQPASSPPAALAQSTAAPPPPTVAAGALTLPPAAPPPPSRLQPPSQSVTAHPLAPKPPSRRDSTGGTDSVSNAIVTGDSVVPARPDASYHNREPIYPPDAANRGERGVVSLLIHVSPPDWRLRLT